MATMIQTAIWVPAPAKEVGGEIPKAKAIAGVKRVRASNRIDCTMVIRGRSKSYYAPILRTKLRWPGDAAKRPARLSNPKTFTSTYQHIASPKIVESATAINASGRRNIICVVSAVMPAPMLMPKTTKATLLTNTFRCRCIPQSPARLTAIAGPVSSGMGSERALEMTAPTSPTPSALSVGLRCDVKRTDQIPMQYRRYTDMQTYFISMNSSIP